MKIKDKDGKFIEVNPKKDKLIKDLEEGNLTLQEVQKILSDILKKRL